MKFNLVLNDEEINSYFYEKGLKLYNVHKKLSRNSLDKYIVDNDALDASKIEEDWFPPIKADIFLSHSHKDEKLAIRFAGWLSEIFHVTVFIDSCVWGYSDELLSIIDKKYCVSEEKTNGGYIYDYGKRNKSTTHVHMILNGALAKMIDSTECIMFLNTPNSIKMNDLMNESITDSSWIYSELLMSKIIRNKKLIEYRKEEIVFAEKQELSHSELNVQYHIETDHLIDISWDDLLYVQKYTPYLEKKYAALDTLYKYKGIFGK